MNNNKNSPLKDQWSGNTDFLVLGSGNVDSKKAVLQQTFDKIYTPNFPASAGYHSVQDLLDIFKDPKSAVDLKITVAGVNLRGKGDPVIKGICASFYYKESDTALLMYLAVDQAFRTEGLGTALFRNHHSIMIDSAHANNGTLKGSYISLQDPKKPLSAAHQEFDTYDPQKRFDKYIGWGGKHVPFNYIYADAAGGKVVTGDECALIAFKHPVNGSYPSRDTTLAFMRALWRDGGIDAPEKHPAFQKMVQSYKKPAPPSTPGKKPKP